MDDPQAAGVEGLRGDVLRVHHAFATGQRRGVPDRLAQVVVGQLDRADRVAQRRLEVQPRDVGLRGVREHVEPALRGVVDRAAVVEHRVVDRQAGDRGVVEGDVLVRVVGVRRRVGDDVGPRGLRAGAGRGGDRDVRRVLRVLRLVESLELVDVAAVVGDRDPRAPLQASWLEPPPIESKLSQAFCWYNDTASMTL